MKCLNEVEVKGKIPFIDLCIYHVNDKISSTWYCKPTVYEFP